MEKSSDLQASEEGEIFFPSLLYLDIRGLKRLKGLWKGVDDDHRFNTAPLIFRLLSDLDIVDCRELMSFSLCARVERVSLVQNNEVLHVIVKTTGRAGDSNLSNSQVTAKLRELDIDNLSHLKSLPINCLCISKFETVDTEESVSEAFERFAASLQDFRIWGIKNMRRLCGGSGLEHFTALESLELGYVIPRLSIKGEEDDDEDDNLFWKSIPQNLRTLQLFFLQEETSLPKGLQYLTSLSNLQLIQCEKLEWLPDWIDCLSSLQSLHILIFPAIKSIPESMYNLTSLQRLCIRVCPDLVQRCKEPDGEDYPKIRHIPDIDLDD